MTGHHNTDLEPYDIWTQTEDIMNDPINHPAHYQKGGIETIEVLEAKLSPEEFQGYCIGNALKYLTRRNYKGKPLEDMKKAHWYLTRALGAPVEPDVFECVQPDCSQDSVENRLYCKHHLLSSGAIQGVDDGK